MGASLSGGEKKTQFKLVSWWLSKKKVTSFTRRTKLSSYLPKPFFKTRLNSQNSVLFVSLVENPKLRLSQFSKAQSWGGLRTPSGNPGPEGPSPVPPSSCGRAWDLAQHSYNSLHKAARRRPGGAEVDFTGIHAALAFTFVQLAHICNKANSTSWMTPSSCDSLKGSILYNPSGSWPVLSQLFSAWWISPDSQKRGISTCMRSLDGACPLPVIPHDHLNKKPVIGQVQR